MRLPSRLSIVVAVAAFTSACGGDRPGSSVSCQRDRDCPTGQGTCTVNGDCDSGFVCNSQLHSCAQCTFDQQCQGVAGKTHCDGASGTCVACNANIDCVTLVGTGHYCDPGHTCKPGCLHDADCSASTGERCDGATATTPGKCIQCKTNLDCQSTGATACDETSHCVQCAGRTQGAANQFCGSGTPECNLATRTCVACLPANNRSGADCGYPVGPGKLDSHDAKTCDAATSSCVDGCQFDEQCGCVRNGSGDEGNCFRNPDGEHCDPTRTAMKGADGTFRPSLGGCVQCLTNAHCQSRRTSAAGSRCHSDACEPYCDSDAECVLPDAANPGATKQLLCQQTAGHDVQHKTCTECACEVPSAADGTYCEVKLDGSAACAPSGSGNPRVCDKATLLCRKKRQNEQCLTSGECGDVNDPTIGACNPIPGFCAFHSHSGTTAGDTERYCSAAKNLGRCGVPCDDYPNNRCVGTTPCPSGSACSQATNEGSGPGAGQVCVAQSCNYH